MKRIMVIGIIGSLGLGAQFVSATLLSIVNPDYDPGVTSNTNGWSNLSPIGYSGEWAVDGARNAPGSTGGSMYFGNTLYGFGSPTQPWIYQKLTATADALSNYSLNVSLYDYLSTGDGVWHYKVDLFTADVGENPNTATLLGSLDINPSDIPESGWTNVTLSVLGSSIPGGELGKNLMIAATLAPSGSPSTVLWGYADHWSLDAELPAVPEPGTVMLLGLGSLMCWIRRRAGK